MTGGVATLRTDSAMKWIADRRKPFTSTLGYRMGSQAVEEQQLPKAFEELNTNEFRIGPKITLKH